LRECITHGREKFFIVERFDEKGDRADGHGGGACGQIVSRFSKTRTVIIARSINPSYILAMLKVTG
jgi:hypothetical protein